MPNPDPYALAPMVSKLRKRSQLGPDEADALLALPYRLGAVDAGSYLVREGDRSDHDCLTKSAAALTLPR